MNAEHTSKNTFKERLKSKAFFILNFAMSLKKLLFQFYIENVKFILEQVSSLLFEEAITANRI